MLFTSEARVRTTTPADQKVYRLRQELGEIVARTVQEVARDNFNRMREISFENLTRGIWYVSDYYPRLKKLASSNVSAAERLKWFRDHDRFFFLTS